MKLNLELKRYFYRFFKSVKSFILCFLLLTLIVNIPIKVLAETTNEGEHLFLKHCSGCHINGGNIIRRNKTLKLKDLHRNNLDSPESIANIAKDGIGIMSGYKEVLGEKGAEIVSIWIWEESQNAWVHG